MIVLTEFSAQLPPSASARDLAKATEAARLTRNIVFGIPSDFDLCETAENALAHIPTQSKPTPAVWIGYVPTPEKYGEIYTAAKAKNIVLVNTPNEHLTAQEFDRAYPYLLGLTPESIVLTDVVQCRDVAETLGLPIFVKGAVQSRKSRGWKACVAESVTELERLCRELFALENRSRGRVIARRLVPLRHSRASHDGFPFGREYRVFLFRENVLGWGYYWEGDDVLEALSETEEQIVLTLAREAARRINTPYLAVDIGQQENGQWIVIECGDAQFSGVSQTPLLTLWKNLRDATSFPPLTEA